MLKGLMKWVELIMVSFWFICDVVGSDLPLDRSGSVLGQPVRRVPMDRRDDLDSKGHVISQLMDSNSQLLSQVSYSLRR